MIDELYNPGKLIGILKNKYGLIVLTKTMKYLSDNEKREKKQYVLNKINVTSSKEKIRLNDFLDSLSIGI
jgi:hypothetical protein